MPSELGRELEILREAAVAASSSLEGDEILETVREHALRLFHADFATAVVAGPAWADGRPLPDWRGLPLPEPLPEVASGALRAGECRVERDLPAAPDGLRAAVAAPLRHGDDVRGVLLLAWRDPAGVRPETTQLAETLAVHTAVALHNARLHHELRRSTQGRDRFFSAMSHDLRTPIAAIVGYSELLADGIVGDLSSKQQEMVERISQVAAHLTELVNDILDLAKLDAGRVELRPEPVRLGELVDDALLEVEPQARAKGLPLRPELDRAGDETVVVDPVRVRQILVNLLGNAVKFTERGEVRVQAGVHGARTWITVRDTGPGLPAGTEDAVFEEFMQLPTGRGEEPKPGNGLGLALSRRLARAMGGDLTVESTLGEGSAFTLFLPLRRE
ncbi:MAG TPA: ATP-binding protein [Longimicrobiaceae bacterium]